MCRQEQSPGLEEGGGPRKGLSPSRTWDPSPSAGAGRGAGRGPAPQHTPWHPSSPSDKGGTEQRVKPEPFIFVLQELRKEEAGAGRAAAEPQPEEGAGEKSRKRGAGPERPWGEPAGLDTKASCAAMGDSTAVPMAHPQHPLVIARGNRPTLGLLLEWIHVAAGRPPGNWESWAGAW